MRSGGQVSAAATARPARSARRRGANSASLPDTLSQEVILLSSALSQLGSGQAVMALDSLDEHQRRFPNGLLTDERNAAKARALCILQRFSEGRAELAALSPSTPLAARVKEDCDSASSRAEESDRSQETGHD